jgi:hypothetical protein
MSTLSPENLQNLTESSKKLYEKLRDNRPDLLGYCEIEERDNKSILLVKIPSPKNDPRCEIILSFENDDDDITLFFGEWHSHGWELFLPTHEPIEEYVELLDFVSLIQADTFCLLYELSENPKVADLIGNPQIIDMRNEDSILEALTNKYSSGRVKLKSWSGKRDRVLTVENYKLR